MGPGARPCCGLSAGPPLPATGAAPEASQGEPEARSWLSQPPPRPEGPRQDGGFAAPLRLAGEGPGKLRPSVLI